MTKVNETTRRILRALATDARLTPAQLGRMFGIDEAAAAAEVARLEREGIIRRYKTVIDWERVEDERVIAFIDVSVSPQRDVGFDQIAARIARFPEVRSVYLVSGGSDLRVAVEGADMRDISSFVSTKLAPTEHVTATNTHFMLKIYKEDGELLTEAPAPDQRLAVVP